MWQFVKRVKQMPTSKMPPESSGFVPTVVTVATIVSAVAAVAAILVTYQVSRISDLGADIKTTSSRIDQLYPLVAQSTADIGVIKG